MVTPLEIENKEFSKGVRGYSMDEVDDFLDLIIVSMEKLRRENAFLSEKVKQLQEEIATTKNIEHNTNEILNSAKKLVTEISAGAEKRAESIIQNAVLDAKKINKEATDAVQRYAEEAETLKKKVAQLNSSYKNMLQRELDRINYQQEDFIQEIDKYFMTPKEEVLKTLDKTQYSAPRREVSREDLAKTIHK